MSLPSGRTFGRALFVVLVSIAIAVLLVTLRGHAATPGSGTISPSSPTLAFSGGPFLVANGSGQASDPPVCNPSGTDCDSFALHVDFPPGYHAAHPYDRVVVSVGWPHVPGVTDFDVYFLDEGDNTVMHGASEENPERFTFGACPGTFDRTILIVPFAPNGQSYSATVELVTGTDRVDCGLPEDADSDFDGVVDLDDDCAGTPVGTSVNRSGCALPVPGPGVPRFFVYMAPQGVAQSVGEPSIGCNYKTEQTFTNTNVDGSSNSLPNGGTVLSFGGFSTNLYKTTFSDCQSPAEATWELKPLLSAASPRAAGDPILFTDNVRGRTFVAQLEALTPAGSTIDITDDDGDNFVPSDGIPASDIDHQTIGAGPYHAPLTGGTPVYPNAVYYASQSVSDARAHRSDNGGVAFGAGTLMYTTADCGGLHGHLKVAPDGTVYVPNNACGGTDALVHNDGQQAVIVSQDNGNTWTIRQVPGSTTKSARDPSVGIATDSQTIYLGMQAANGHPMIAKSSDYGVHWSTPFDVGASVVNGGPVQNMVFAAVVAGDPDRAAFAFFGTESDIGHYSDPLFVGNWYLYVATTFDGGATWRTENVTPGDPIQRGGICGGGGCRNLLDFFDATIDKEGRVLVMIEDGCVSDACIHGGANDFSAKGGVLRQTGGKRMFAAFDPVEPARPGAPAISGTVDATNTIATLTWPTPDHGGAAITGYKVYRKAGASGAPVLLGTVSAPPFSDTSFDAALDNYYHVTAVNAIGEGPFCKDLKPAVLLGQENICVSPGVTVLVDSADDALDAQPAHDVRRLSLSEPYSGGAYKVAFHLKMAGLSSVPSGGTWPVNFCAPKFPCSDPNVAFGATNKFYTVQMVSTGAGNPNPNPIFQIRVPNAADTTRATIAADPASAFTADGLITIVANAPDVGLDPANAGSESLSKFQVRIRQESGAGPALTPDNMPDSLAGAGVWNSADLAYCASNVAPIANLVVTPASGQAPLEVTLDGSGSSDADAGDTIKSYTFSFGDGQQVTQDTPIVTHTYEAAGAYHAVLQVVDSRDVPGVAPAAQNVLVQAGGEAGTTNNRLGGAVPVAMLLLGLAGALVRRRKK